LAEWFGRAQHQLALERVGTWISICCIVKREQCSLGFDMGSLRRLVPQAAGIFGDPSLEVRVAAVGERPPVWRILPSRSDFLLMNLNLPDYHLVGSWWLSPSAAMPDHQFLPMAHGFGELSLTHLEMSLSFCGWSFSWHPP